VAGRIRSIEKSSNLIGIRTCDLLACKIVIQPTMLLCASNLVSSLQVPVVHLFLLFPYKAKEDLPVIR
jgi:hypothetical protein